MTVRIMTISQALVAALLVTACSIPAAPPDGLTPSTSASAPTSPASQPASRPASPETSSPADECAHDRIDVEVHAGDLMELSRCVHEGTQIELTFFAVAGYKWSTVDSSDSAACAVTGSHVDPYGTGHATLHAIHAGSVDITATSSPTTDPGGPPTKLWRLRLRIVS